MTQRARAASTQPGPTTRPTATYDNVAHLLRRAGFGATPAQIEATASAGLSAAVNTLVDYESTADNFTPPLDIAISDLYRYNTNPLSQWWIGRMIGGSRQLQEKMTLFWHGHFATANSKVHSTNFMYQQNQTFRSLALGRFDDILTAMLKDPATLIWLDGVKNTKQSPNENYGREVMELFALGRGNYSEDDVHNMARAYTGWQVADANGTVRFNPKLFDDTQKTILGQSGKFTADDANRILANHPATGPFLAGRLWKFFASDAPSTSVISQLGSVYYSSNHSIREMVRAMFLMPEFYSNATKIGHIKSPTEFVVTTIRQLGIADKINTQTLPAALTLLGQELFNPPNVGGWPGGSFWINAATMLGRFNFASRLTGIATGNPAQSLIDAEAVYQSSNANTTGDLIAYITDLLGFTPSVNTSRALVGYVGQGSAAQVGVVNKVNGLMHLALVSPDYQAS